jgi:hypothetical protein
MMNARAWDEARLVAAHFPDLEVRPSDGWARVPSYAVPSDTWTVADTELAFRFPGDLPGQAPYGFWVRPALVLTSGDPIQNVTVATTPFGGEWMQFSWAVDPWRPGATPTDGDNMLHFVRSFGHRLAEGS